MNTELRFVVAIVLMVAVLVVTNLLFPPTPPALSVTGTQDTASAPEGGPSRATERPPAQVFSRF